MRSAATILAGLALLVLTQLAAAAPDRDSLVAAWEAHVRELPGTQSFEKTGDDSYRLTDTDLPYDGELKVLGALVRSSESPGFEIEFTHLGMVEFELSDLPAERLTSQVYYYWLADRQTLHYSKETGQWVDTAVYRDAISEWYPESTSFGALSFMVSYGIWILLGIVLIWGFIAVGQQTKKAQALMDDSASLNDKASANLDRAEKLQDEVLAIARESRDLQAENNRLLGQMLETLRR